jgi:2-polyprenyl-6-methoxyphenol hydroxylase-like FAD-dependent oxidoreductase
MKVAISGAGIAGPTLAYWLQRTGHEPTLIEEAPQFRGGGYILDFWGIGYRVAELMGIEPQVLEAGYHVRTVRAVDRAGRTRATLGTDAFRRSTQGKFISLPRGELAAAIYGAAKTGVETIFGDSIAAIRQDGHGVRIAFTHGAEREFDLLVGADGLHSNVRRLAFGPEENFSKHLGYKVAAFELEGYRPRNELEYVLFNIPGGQVGRFSLRGDRTLFLFVVRASAPHREVPGDLAACKVLLNRTFANAGWECSRILTAMQGVDDIYFDDVSQIRMGRWSNERIALIGDAAACVSLLAGEGAGLAMTEAYVLAGELKRANNDYREAFRNHETRLRALVEGKQRSAETFASFFAPKSQLGIWARNTAMQAMTIGAVADLLVGRSLRDDFDLPNYDMQ